MKFVQVFLVVFSIIQLTGNGSAEEPRKFNVILIIVDDLNGNIGCMNGNIGAQTPNIDRLMGSGTLFTNAHCAAPICNPSRTALLTGLRPSTTGIYDNSQAATPDDHMLKKLVLLPQHFKNNGYSVIGAGKIPGHSTGRIGWDETFDRPSDKSEDNENAHSWGTATETMEEMSDWKLAGWAANQLEKNHSKPFFLAVGFVKPHLPWKVPKEYFDRFAPGSVKPEPLKEDDDQDLPSVARKKKSRAINELISKRTEAVTAYFAAMAFADDCLGRVIAALEKGPNRDNTIVVVCGDNGFQFGEKDAFGKGTLWEESTHVPLFIAAPGMPKSQRCAKPVCLTDLYPTLSEICGLTSVVGLEGTSLVPLLKDPKSAWEHAAVSTMGSGNHAVRTERWRYIRYENGSEELYDHEKDPQEWTNLASDQKFSQVIVELRRWLPSKDAPRNPDTK